MIRCSLLQVSFASDGFPSDMMKARIEANSQMLATRTEALFLAHCDRGHRWADLLFGKLLICQWFVAIAVAVWISPLSWSGATSKIHPHVWLAVVLGLIVISLPVWLAHHRPGRFSTRLTIGCAQVLLSSILIHLTGGRIETHFHVFCSLAVLAFYRDWRVLVAASATVLLDHVLRALFAPESVFGSPATDVWRAFEHGGWVVLEDIFLILATNNALQETRSHARREAELEFLNQTTERAIADRTTELRASVARTHSILDAALDAIISIDSHGRIIEFNPAAETMFGLNASDVIGQPLSTMLMKPDVTPGERDDVAALIADDCAPMLGRRVELEGFHRSGRRFPVEVAIVITGATTRSYTAFIRDISERRQIEKDQLKAKQQAEEASRAKSQFLASMSHELRTPLNGVIGMTELLIGTRLDDRQLQFARACQTSGRALLDLINDILDVSKIEAGKLELDRHDFDLEQLVRDTTDLFGMRANEAGPELICEFDLNARQIYSGDSTRLRQVMVNLLSNSRKFTDRGEIVLSVSRIEQHDSTATLRFSVRDTGIGIPADRIHRLFQSFSQVDSSTTRKYGGTGLGLAISKHLVTAMGGTIGVESQVGEGTTFWFTLPLPVVGDCEIQSSQNKSNFQNLRVLIVDDNATNRTIIQEQVRGWGMLPTTACSVEDALLLFNLPESPFDLVISDYHMPNQTGIDLAIELKRRGIQPPFVLLGSSMTEPAFNEMIRAAGIRQQLTKPVLSTQLYTALQSVVQSPKSPPSAPPSTEKDAASSPAQASPVFKGELLVAEDNAVNLLYVTSVLNRAGYTTQTASNGLQAVLAVRTQRFALVLMDCQMPELDGYEATRCIRNLEAKGRLSGHVPIVALTANAIKGDSERCLDAGMDAYLSKPFDPQQLISLVEKLSLPCQVEDEVADFTEFGDEPNQVADQADSPAEQSGGNPVSSRVSLEQPSPAERASPIDKDLLLNRCMGSLDFMESLLSELQASGMSHVDEIARHNSANDVVKTGNAAHALKGAAGILSAEPIRKLAAGIEQATRTGSLEGVSEAVDELRLEMNRCLAFIPTLKRSEDVIEPAQMSEAFQ
jgi:PAS domain S-box-containing protein